MQKVLINLDRSTGRLETFYRMNSHIKDIERFSAIDGRGLRQTLKEKGLLQEGFGVDYTDGGLGCAMSHKAQWERAVASGEALTVIEDDAVFCKNFEEEHQRLLETLPETWDIVLWGYILGLDLSYDLLPELPYYIKYNTFNIKSSMKNIDRWSERCISSNFHKLYMAWGLACYSISPRGAKKFLEFCFPIRRLPVKRKNILLKQKGLYYPNKVNDGIDCPMVFLYPKVEAYVCVPLLVKQPYLLKTSSVQPLRRSFHNQLKRWLFRKTMEVDYEGFYQSGCSSALSDLNYLMLENLK